MQSQLIFALNATRDILLFLALVFAFATLKHFWTKELTTEMMRIKKPVFTLLFVAIFFFTLGFLFINPFELPDQRAYTLLNTAFFTISYTAFIAALSYFWHNSAKMHKLHRHDMYFCIGVTSGVFIWLHYLFETTLISAVAQQPFEKQALFLIHPLAVSLIFLLTMAVQPRYRAGLIRAPLFYISGAIFTYFLGYMVLTYSVLSQSGYGLEVLYSILFLLSALYFFLGFYIAERTYAKE